MELNIYNASNCNLSEWMAENGNPCAIVIEGKVYIDKISSFIRELSAVLGRSIVDVEFSNFYIDNGLISMEWYCYGETGSTKDEQTLMALRMLSNLDSCKHFVLRDGMALSIDSKSFSHFPPVEDVVIPKTIEYIGHNAFNMRESMKSLMLNDGLRRIGNSAFDLKVLKLPDTVETVGEPQKIQMRRSHNVYNSDCGIDENYVCRYIFPNDKYSEEDYDEVMSEADYFFGEPYCQDDSGMTGHYTTRTSFSVKTNVK